MISRLEGVLAEKTAASVVVMAGGVGYEVFIPLSTFYELPEEGIRVVFYVKTLLRDDSIDLFGFLTREEKEAFLLLNSVSRIGPRLALNILSSISPAGLVEAIVNKNPARLSALPGVGVKTAERLIWELKDKAAKLAALVPAEVGPPTAAPIDDLSRDVISALQNLGYPKPQAEKAVNEARREAGEGKEDLSSLLRLSLRRLQKL